MRTWSLETVLVKAYATAAVAAQGLIDVFTHRPGYNSGAHPIPGCPNGSDCREYGCAGDCSEASEADERLSEPESEEDTATLSQWSLEELFKLKARVDGGRWGEPPLNSSEIVGVRQLLEERFGDAIGTPDDCSISCPPAVSATAAGCSPAGVDASFSPEVPPAGFPRPWSMLADAMTQHRPVEPAYERLTSNLLSTAADLLDGRLGRLSSDDAQAFIKQLRDRAAVFVDIEQDK